ncbi:MAG TPA: prepilin-type N-terminal cleavage/methylation domain-containing protein [Pyrinomonadaceae bacterium]|nr:prepilin-type N-terminal cleavage/methylation domain-containing protein [Pyrinomonadaceae bacterium]
MSKEYCKASSSAGFSLIELMVAMGVTLVIMVIASTLLGQAFNVRTRENSRTEALADVQRALNSMSREIANAGFGLNSMTTNGIVTADSNASQIRVRANLDAFAGGTPSTAGSDEDVVFAIANNGSQRLITRYNVNAGATAISSLANRVDTLTFEYLNANNTTATGPGTAEKVRITVGVTLPAVGTAGTRGYQPASRTQVTSEVTLRNKNLTQF